MVLYIMVALSAVRRRLRWSMYGRNAANSTNLLMCFFVVGSAKRSCHKHLVTHIRSRCMPSIYRSLSLCQFYNFGMGATGAFRGHVVGYEEITSTWMEVRRW